MPRVWSVKQGALVCLLGILGSGCASVAGPEEEITYASEWFTCKSRFSCVVVQDAFCKQTAVNAKSAIVYQDWSRQEVTRQGERSVCPRPEEFNPVAACIRGRCAYPFSRADISGAK